MKMKRVRVIRVVDKSDVERLPQCSANCRSWHSAVVRPRVVPVALRNFNALLDGMQYDLTPLWV
jgi:hypothetical protein